MVDSAQNRRREGRDASSDGRRPGPAGAPGNERCVPPDCGRRVVWATVVRAANAGAIRLHVQDMSLPRNAELYVYSRGGQAYGPYTGSGPDGTGDFWVTGGLRRRGDRPDPAPGTGAQADLRDVSLRIVGGRAHHQEVCRQPAADSRGTFPRAEKASCDNPSCMVDATCTNVAAANPAKLAIAKMEWVQGASIFTCTGGLISDNNPSQGNFFLTANHCLSKNNAPGTSASTGAIATSSCNGTAAPSTVAGPT